MSLPVSDAFIAAQLADSNKPVSQVQLVLGNYFSASAYGTTVAASGAAANYPAAGAIDGDRTEINIGAASAADNDVGQSSWRSTVAPDTTPQTLTMTFSQSRTLNRIKLYHLAASGLKTYRLAYWDGSAYVNFAATSDIAGVGEVSITSTHQLDTIDFDDISTTKIRLTVSATVVAADPANVVEIEAYRLVDITDRVKGVRVQRQRDFKLGNPMATVVSLDCINDDRFFSISHTPTTAEVADGFVNSELQPGMGILVAMGFDIAAGEQEVASLLVASVDRLTIRPQTRDVKIEGRDGMKALINKIDSSKLKTSTDIGTIVQYVLNRANISNYEMHLDTTSISLDYFFSDQQDQLSTIQDLVQAAGDATFYFDEYGFAVFKFFSTSTTLQHIYTSQADWEAGTLDAIDTTTVPGQISYQLKKATTWNNATAGWSSTLSGVSFAHDADGLALTITSNSGAGESAIITRALTATIGEWSLTFREGAANSNSSGFQINILRATTAVGSNRYYVAMIPSTFANTYVFSINKVVSGLFTEIARTGPLASRNRGTVHTMRITRNALGNFVLYIDGTQVLAATDLAITTSVLFGYTMTSGGGALGDVVHFQDNYPYIPGGTGTGTWTGPALDMGATITSLGILSFTQVLSGGTTAYYTATSADNVTYDAFVAISGTGQINSTVRRYIKVKAVLVVDTLNNSPAILDITVNWTTGAGSPKYPPAPSSFTFSFDSVLMDVQQELADNLGGDSAILNDVTVQAQPLVLTGANADVVFQGTIGTPPAAISAGTPLAVTNGQTLTYRPYIPGGMDTSRMSGANPAAGAITFAGGGAGSWVFSSIHPTLPVLVITITGTGNITNLQIQGKVFAAATYLQAQNSSDAASKAIYGDRRLSISNQWIVSASLASSIASTIVTNSKNPTSYIPSVDVRPCFAAQIGDRITVEDENLDLSADYVFVGLSHIFNSQGGVADVRTQGTLLKVPAGS